MQLKKIEKKKLEYGKKKWNFSSFPSRVCIITTGALKVMNQFIILNPFP